MQLELETAAELVLARFLEPKIRFGHVSSQKNQFQTYFLKCEGRKNRFCCSFSVVRTFIAVDGEV